MDLAVIGLTYIAWSAFWMGAAASDADHIWGATDGSFRKDALRSLGMMLASGIVLPAALLAVGYDRASLWFKTKVSK